MELPAPPTPPPLRTIIEGVDPRITNPPRCPVCGSEMYNAGFLWAKWKCPQFIECGYEGMG